MATNQIKLKVVIDFSKMIKQLEQFSEALHTFILDLKEKNERETE